MNLKQLSIIYTMLNELYVNFESCFMQFISKLLAVLLLIGNDHDSNPKL